MIFCIGSLLWGILMGLFVAVACLLLATTENSTHAFSRTSGSSRSRKLEFIALLIPTSGVVVINQFVLLVLHLQTSGVVDITGLQWYWIIDGSDVTLTNSVSIGTLFGLFTTNILVVTLSFAVLLSAVDVIHAIALPGLGVKADAIPGRLVNLRVDCEIPGSYYGQCSELCGAMHAFMPLSIIAVLALSYWKES